VTAAVKQQETIQNGRTHLPKLYSSEKEVIMAAAAAAAIRCVLAPFSNTVAVAVDGSLESGMESA
jgi:hypothetical protein